MKKKIAAFTLIEALVVGALISILMAFGLPGMQSFIINNGLTSTNNDIVATLQYARSEAIKRARPGERVVVCLSNNSMDVNPACGSIATMNWQDGWIVFYDTNNDAVYTAGTDTLLQQQTGVASDQITITPDVVTALSPLTITDYVSFDSRGNPLTVAGVNQSGLFRICSTADTTKIRGVMLAASGRVASSREPAVVGSCT